MPSARRCEFACEPWPDLQMYSTCPACGEPTRVFTSDGTKPLTQLEAAPLAAQYKFERFYADYDETADPARLEPGEAEELLAQHADLPTPTSNALEAWPVLDSA